MIDMPWPPSVNHYYTVARGRKILSKRGRDYKRTAGLEILAQKPAKHKGRISINIHAHPPNKRKRDLDNLLKPCLDVLVETGIISDDSDINDLRIQKFPPVKAGYLKIWIESW